jgi:hypothetical protein
LSFENAESFQKKIFAYRQKISSKQYPMDMVDVITSYIEHRKQYGEFIEYESIVPFVTGKLKAELQRDYEKRNMFKKKYVKPECSLSDVFSNA